jgi:hypothetical protein
LVYFFLVTDNVPASTTCARIAHMGVDALFHTVFFFTIQFFL